MSADEWRAEQEHKKLVESIKANAQTRYEFFGGVDLGKTQDSTAVAIIERKTTKTKTGDEVQTGLKFLAQIKPGRTYTEQVAALETLFSCAAFKLWGMSSLIDASGVGEPVADMLAERKIINFKRAQITSGDGVSQKRGRIYASRNSLIGGLSKALRTDKLKISADLPLISELIGELSGIGEERAKSGASVYRTSGHDDLVMALALAALAMERKDRAPRTGVTTLF